MPNPGANEVLIEVRAIGVNPVETYLRTGSNPNLALPYTPGTDACGIVLAVGRAVRQAKVGMRVYTGVETVVWAIQPARFGTARCESTSERSTCRRPV